MHAAARPDHSPLTTDRCLPDVFASAIEHFGYRHIISSANSGLVSAPGVTRSLRYDSELFTTGYVESVAVRADQQGRGLGRLLMDDAEAIIRVQHQLGDLNAVESAAPFHAARGWRPWNGHTQADTPTVWSIPTTRMFGSFVLPAVGAGDRFPETSPLICDWRAGDLWWLV